MSGETMAIDKMWHAPDIVPSMTYSDVPRAVAWLERVLGFRERVEVRLSWPGGGLAWMEVGDGLFSITTPSVAGRVRVNGDPLVKV
jgi:hypothetical protein